MVTVYVKHYLDKVGLDYFQNTWLPLHVEPVISQQPGFVSIDWQVDETDCGYVTVKFVDDVTLQAWAEKPEHDVVDLLDPYRVKAYWEAAKTENASKDSAELDWVRVDAKSPR
ncbi:MAG: hypothetical protein CMF39_03330 [Legionellaceae bacterium]|nr:hypothetical protein [Legionellaceae bacterium]